MAAAIPSDVRAFSTPVAATSGALTLPDAETRLSLSFASPVSFTAFDEKQGGGGAKKWLPVGMSLLIPGTGEIYLGYYWRGAALVALEVAAWTGYVINSDDGNQKEVEYRRFADAHWAESKWIDDHNAWPANWPDEDKTYENLDSIGSDFSYSGWPGYHSHTFPEENAINYYENIGKYDWFISGWEDWDPIANPKQTDLRTQYRAMRKESDDAHDRAQRFVYLSLAVRAFSLVETTILVTRDKDKRVEQAARPDRELRLKTKAKGFMGGEVALEYRF